MANKIYLLINDAEDEREILAAFSTRESANAAHRFGGSRSAIEEVELDPQLPTAPKGHSIWSVTAEGTEEPCAVQLDAFDLSGLENVLVDDEEYRVEIWALGEEHALQLGLPRIEQFKKEQGVGA